MSIDVAETSSSLAGAATASRPTPSATAAATTAAAASPAATATAAPAAATPAAPGELVAGLGRRSAFLIEHIEGRQADVGNLFLTEEELMLWYRVLRRHIGRRSASCCRRPTGHSERYAGDSQNGDGLAPAVSFRG